MGGSEARHIVAVDKGDQAVFVADPPRPATSQGVTQVFWLADTGERVTQEVRRKPASAGGKSKRGTCEGMSRRPSEVSQAVLALGVTANPRTDHAEVS